MVDTWRKLAAVAGVALIAASCGGADSAPSTNPPGSAVTSSPRGETLVTEPTGSVCPALDEEGLPATYRRVGKQRDAEVTGDHRPDLVTVYGDEDRPERCRYYLVVQRSGAVVAAARIPAIPWLPVAPSLLMNVELDGEPGLEMVVDSGGPMHPHRAGQIFTFDEESLARMVRRPTRSVPRGLFPLHDEFVGGVDCAGEPGSIVVTVGSFAEEGTDEGHYDVTRTFYRARGTVFIGIRQEFFRVESGTERERWPELADDPFRSC